MIRFAWSLGFSLQWDARARAFTLVLPFLIFCLRFARPETPAAVSAAEQDERLLLEAVAAHAVPWAVLRTRVQMDTQRLVKARERLVAAGKLTEGRNDQGQRILVLP